MNRPTGDRRHIVFRYLIPKFESWDTTTPIIKNRTLIQAGEGESLGKVNVCSTILLSPPHTSKTLKSLQAVRKSVVKGLVSAVHGYRHNPNRNPYHLKSKSKHYVNNQTLLLVRLPTMRRDPILGNFVHFYIFSYRIVNLLTLYWHVMCYRDPSFIGWLGKWWEYDNSAPSGQELFFLLWTINTIGCHLRWCSFFLSVSVFGSFWPYCTTYVSLAISWFSDKMHIPQSSQ